MENMCRGMVQSAFEFAEVCREMDYHNFLFSMKASNPLVMVQAYRLLAAEQYALGWDYPLHLGYALATGESQHATCMPHRLQQQDCVSNTKRKGTEHAKAVFFKNRTVKTRRTKGCVPRFLNVCWACAV